MSRSFKKHAYYISPLAEPHSKKGRKKLKHVAVWKVRRYKYFEDVSDGHGTKKYLTAIKYLGGVAGDSG